VLENTSPALYVARYIKCGDSFVAIDHIQTSQTRVVAGKARLIRYSLHAESLATEKVTTDCGVDAMPYRMQTGVVPHERFGKLTTIAKRDDSGDLANIGWVENNIRKRPVDKTCSALGPAVTKSGRITGGDHRGKMPSK
jgi:hypothetical protein